MHTTTAKLPPATFTSADLSFRISITMFVEEKWVAGEDEVEDVLKVLKDLTLKYSRSCKTNFEKLTTNPRSETPIETKRGFCW